jgi:regulator of RNase E activity RraA
MAVADGNVCAVASAARGGWVDGVIRDVAESRGRLPVFARGVSPIPGRQTAPARSAV